MILARYATDDGAFLGLFANGGLVDLIPATGRSDDVLLRLVEHRKLPRGKERALSDVRLLAPIVAPSKIVCVGLNYRDHCVETNSPIPDHPVLFAKFPSCIVGPGDEIRFRRSLTTRVDFEVELAVVIGRRCSNVDESSALDNVLGVTVANDVTARDLQFLDSQWLLGKSLDTFLPLGPWIATLDEVGDVQNLRLRCSVNGKTYQDSSTREMIFGVAALVSYISSRITLEPCDVLLTGTPSGVGFTRKPPVYLKNGDTVTVEIERIGKVENPVVGADVGPLTSD